MKADAPAFLSAKRLRDSHGETLRELWRRLAGLDPLDLQVAALMRDLGMTTEDGAYPPGCPNERKGCRGQPMIIGGCSEC